MDSKSKIHKVKKPFMCFKGQFVKDERHLCIGVKLNVLQSKKIHQAQVGNRIYDINCEKALEIAYNQKSFYKDNDVVIVPIDLVSVRVQVVKPESPQDAPEKTLDTKTTKTQAQPQMFDLEPLTKPKDIDKSRWA